jgi:soluble lytic murein transglycosylase-like protein
MMRLLAILAVGLSLAVAVPATASAELVFLSSGRTLSVQAHRVDGETVVLFLRGGGQVVCGQSAVLRIEPDEYPHPDPAQETAGALDATPLAARYAEIIARSAAAHGVDPKLVRAVIEVESRYQERALSPKGAMGLMQLMPQTARNLQVPDPYDPRANIDAGIRHLRSLLDRFDLSLALAAYNAGEAAVDKFKGIPPYPETRNYVRDVLQLAGLGSNPR